LVGAASGFGKALAERLISLKGKVILGDVNDEQGNILAALLNKQYIKY
jgi:NAD(P)-dependent dehydrogenase (short-subunit alcohol dehydrogenase family)